MGIGDWGLGIGDWAQSPIPNPQSPIPKLNLLRDNINNKNFHKIVGVVPSISKTNNKATSTVLFKSLKSKMVLPQTIDVICSYIGVTLVNNYIFSRYFTDSRNKAYELFKSVYEHTYYSKKKNKAQRKAFKNSNKYLDFYSREDEEFNTNHFSFLTYFFIDKQTFHSNIYSMTNFYTKVVYQEEEFFLFRADKRKIFACYIEYLPFNLLRNEAFLKKASTVRESKRSIEQINYGIKLHISSEKLLNKKEKITEKIKAIKEHSVSNSLNALLGSTVIDTENLDEANNILLKTCGVILEFSFEVDDVLGAVVQRIVKPSIVIYSIASGVSCCKGVDFQHAVPVVNNDLVNYFDPYVTRDICKIVKCFVFELSGK